MNQSGRDSDSRLFAGIMTGTSADGADAVLARFGAKVEVVSQSRVPAPSALAEELRELARNNGGETARAMSAARELTLLCAEAFAGLHAAPGTVAAVGCHGQTVLHRPRDGLTLQLLDGALLAEKTGADVVCDFRARDIAAGGEGAPLAPLFHREVFADFAPCAVVNIGGIANITVLDANNDATGWDLGPGNMLLDANHREHRGGDFDADGAWAAGGNVCAALLAKLRAHPFCLRRPPKSCGREEFDLSRFRDGLRDVSPQDAQATFLEWTAGLIAGAAGESGTAKIFLCGGGAKNGALRERIAALFAGEVCDSAEAGIPADAMEAAAFAWLAKKHLDGAALDARKITGAVAPRILGARYPRQQ